MKKRCIFGIFPIWLDFSKNNDSPEISGFWSGTACFIDEHLSTFCLLVSFGNWGREEFAFFPYSENNCKYWFQAIWKIIFLDKNES